MNDESAADPIDAIEKVLQQSEANQEDANPGPEASVEPEADPETEQETSETTEAETQEGEAKEVEEPDAVEVADTLDGIAEQLGVNPKDLGEHVKVKVGDSEVPLGELANGYMMQSDYSKKTQALSQERESFTTERDTFNMQQNQSLQRLAALEQRIEGLLGEVQIDPNLRDTDPDRFNSLMWDRQDRAQKINAVRAELDQAGRNFFNAEQNAKQQYVVSESEKVQAGWSDVTRDKIAELRGWTAEQTGLSNQEVESLTDSRVILFLRKAKDNSDRLNKLEADKPAALKKVKKLPKLTKPGAKRDKTNAQDKMKAAQGRLRKSGNTDDFANMLLADENFMRN